MPSVNHRHMLFRVLVLVAAGLVLTVAPAAAAAAATTGAPATELCAAIPPRQADAPTGTELVDRLAMASSAERERAFVEQLLAGNVPAFLRQLQAVEMGDRGPAGERLTIWVMPDYLAIGSDADYLRVPLGLDAALRVARRFGFTLPTPKMVDGIHRQARRQLAPRPMTPGPAMTSLGYIAEHNRTIEDQLAGSPPGALVAGDKKDLVLTGRLDAHPDRVAIYGWHHVNGQPIQPLSTVHGARYADYSHGIRLVSSTVFVEQSPRPIFDVLESRALASLLSAEGVSGIARRLLGPVVAEMPSVRAALGPELRSN